MEDHIKHSVIDIPVQDPPEEEFSASDLTWTKFSTNEHSVDDVALIPYSRVDAFINGECCSAEFPTRFHIERGRKRAKGSLKECKNDDYLLYRLYWCSFGPENHGEEGTLLPSRRYRLNTRNRAARPQSMRGCTCHFVVKRLYARPSVAMLIYHERRHINQSGFVCHGPLDKDAIGPRAKNVPYVGNEVQQQTMSLIYQGISSENVLQTHIEGIQRFCGPTAGHNASQYVQKLELIIKRSSHELDLDDQESIRLWVKKNRKSVFFHQESTDTDPFILGIQTEWQLQQMVRFGHQSLLAVDSSFGISKLKYPLCTILAFDSRLHPLPVAWIITRTIAKEHVSNWLKALVARIHGVDPVWSISGFLFDDPTIEICPIRDSFSCPILFCLWRIRKSWLRNVIKRCNNIEVQREMFKHLGKILYSIWNTTNTMEVLMDFIQEFIDQTTFIQYFKDKWVPKIEMWIQTIRKFPLTGLEACGAIETYHAKLKLKVYDDSQLGSLQRVDWLVHKLTTEIHSSYWLDLYSDENGSFQTVKEDYISSTSWHRALQIPNAAVSFDDKDHLFAVVVSQKDNNQSHLIWNPGSEFAFCDCSWSMQANLCKHVIKVNMICHASRHYAPSMAYQSFQTILQNIRGKPTDDSIGLDQSMAWTSQMYGKVERLVELNRSTDIGLVVKDLPMKWIGRKGRTLVGKPLSYTSPLFKNSKRAPLKKNKKRKTLSRLKD